MTTSSTWTSRTWAPKCPRCDSRDVKDSCAEMDAGDETVVATHECERCSTRFRVTPPTFAPRMVEVGP